MLCDCTDAMSWSLMGLVEVWSETRPSHFLPACTFRDVMNPRIAALHDDQKIQKMYGREGCRKEGKNEKEEALWAVNVCECVCTRLASGRLCSLSPFPPGLR